MRATMANAIPTMVMCGTVTPDSHAHVTPRTQHACSEAFHLYRAAAGMPELQAQHQREQHTPWRRLQMVLHLVHQQTLHWP